MCDKIIGLTCETRAKFVHNIPDISLHHISSNIDIIVFNLLSKNDFKEKKTKPHNKTATIKYTLTLG